MSENEKPEKGFVNLPTPERGDSRGATSQELPGAKNAGDEKSARGDSITPSEPDGGASDALADQMAGLKIDAAEDASKDSKAEGGRQQALAIEKRMEFLEAQILRMSEDAANAQTRQTRLLEELAGSQRQAGAGGAIPAPRGTVPGLSDPQQKTVADKETLPEKLDTFLGGDLTTMWINTTRSALTRSLRLVLDETLAKSRVLPDWDDLPPSTSNAERERLIDLDEQLYGLILSSVQAIQTAEKATDRQKNDSRELYAKIDAQTKTQAVESGIAAIAYIKRMTKGESLNESASSMSAIMNLQVKGNSYKHGLTMITTYKSLRAKLEGEISPLWAVTALKRAFKGTSGKVKELSTPILAVFNASEEVNARLPDLGLTNVVKSLETAFEEAAREEVPEPDDRSRGDGGRQPGGWRGGRRGSRYRR